MEVVLVSYLKTCLQFFAVAAVFGCVQYIFCAFVPMFRRLPGSIALTVGLCTVIAKFHLLFQAYFLLMDTSTSFYVTILPHSIYIIPYLAPYFATKFAIKYYNKSKNNEF